MTGAYRVQDIADQCGLSAATVDRVLHGRRGVSARAVRGVEQALLDLDRQQSQLRLGARTLMVDLVMQAPARFSAAVRGALEAELPSARPTAVRLRHHLQESGGVGPLVSVLDSIGGRGRSSQGILLKAPDHPEVAQAVERACSRGIPVLTLVTDVHGCPRSAYVGLDNAAAGATAAYLVSQWLGNRPGDVLVTMSRSTFVGEQERVDTFTEVIGRLAPDRQLVVGSDADGLDAAMAGLVGTALADHPGLGAVYSVGGGNRAVAAAFESAARPLMVFVGHDLDADNLALLRAGVLSAVLHHDLRADARSALRQLLRHHRLVPGAPTSVTAEVQVVTPYNVPARLGPH